MRCSGRRKGERALVLPGVKLSLYIIVTPLVGLYIPALLFIERQYQIRVIDNSGAVLCRPHITIFCLPV
jgi:hypothetical protein